MLKRILTYQSGRKINAVVISSLIVSVIITNSFVIFSPDVDTLIFDRVTETKEARMRGEKWEPRLPIEHVLKKVFGMFPELSFASTTVFG